MTSLQRIRENLGIGQRQLAAILHMEQATVARIETGSRSPTAAQLEKARQLDVLIMLSLPDEEEVIPPVVDDALMLDANIQLLGEMRWELERKERWVKKHEPLLAEHLRLMTLYERMLSEEGSYKPVDYVHLRGARAEVQQRYRGPDATGLAAVKVKITVLKAGIAALEGARA